MIKPEQYDIARCVFTNLSGDQCLKDIDHEGTHEWPATIPQRRLVSIHVTYFNHQEGYFPIDEGKGWKVDTGLRCLIINRPGTNRQYVPLDQVATFQVEVKYV